MNTDHYRPIEDRLGLERKSLLITKKIIAFVRMARVDKNFSRIKSKMVVALHRRRAFFRYAYWFELIEAGS
jgi:hypothetical protein